MATTAERMAGLFADRNPGHYYADFRNAHVKDDGKLVPDYRPVNAAATIEEFEKHLAGEIGLLLVPTSADGMSAWGVIDYDYYSVDRAALARKVTLLKLPLTVCLTKSGGLHFHHWPKKPIKTSEMRQRLSGFASTLGLHNPNPKFCEIFPDANNIPPGSLGHGVNLPYFGGAKAKNHAIDAEGNALSIEQWLDAATRMPEFEQYHAGVADVQGAADILIKHWSSGQKHHLKLYSIGALINAGIDDGIAQQIIDAVPGSAEQRPPSVAHVKQRKESGHHNYGYTSLVQLIGEEDAKEFLRLSGSNPPKDFLRVEFNPVAADWKSIKPEPMQFVIEPQLPKKSVTLLVAEPGTGKTTYSLRMALCVAGGRAFFGMKTRTGKAVYLNLEDNPESMRRRFYWTYQRELEAMRAEGCSEAVIAEFDANLDANLFLTSGVGQEIHLVAKTFGATHQTPAVNALIEKLPAGLELFILDPLARAHGADENSNTDATALINAAERIANATEAAVLIPHHTGKGASKDRDESMNAGRGASGFVSGARSAIRMMLVDAEEAQKYLDMPMRAVADGDVVKVIHNKANDMKKDATFFLQRNGQDFTRFTPALSDVAARRVATLERLLEWYCARGRLPFTKESLKNREVRDEAMAPMKVSREALMAVIEGAVVDGTLTEAGPGPGGGKLLAFREGYHGPGM